MRNKLNADAVSQFTDATAIKGKELDKIIALTPAAVFGCMMFGYRAILVLLVCAASAVLSETVWCLAFKKPVSISDLSSVVIGLLLGMSLPSSLPLWIAAIGSVVAVVLVKLLLGGLGHIYVNPANAARIVLLLLFNAAMSKYFEPSVVVADTVAGATPLAQLSSEEVTFTFKNLFFGRHAGSIGEISAFLLIIGGLYLIGRKVISPIIPASFIGTVAIATLISGDNLSVALFGGGLMLGAIFIASDYTYSPTNKWGRLIFGVGCGLTTFIIRKFTPLSEGVSCSILIMNILVLLINKLTFKNPFGYEKGEGNIFKFKSDMFKFENIMLKLKNVMSKLKGVVLKIKNIKIRNKKKPQ